jgi:hypothetical protein
VWQAPIDLEPKRSNWVHKSLTAEGVAVNVRRPKHNFGCKDLRLIIESDIDIQSVPVLKSDVFLESNRDLHDFAGNSKPSLVSLRRR